MALNVIKNNLTNKLHRYDYDKTTALTERTTATLILLYCPFVTLILNEYINLYHKLPFSYYLMTYYQWAHSAVKSATELSAEWCTFRIALSTYSYLSIVNKV